MRRRLEPESELGGWQRQEAPAPRPKRKHRDKEPKEPKEPKGPKDSEEPVEVMEELRRIQQLPAAEAQKAYKGLLRAWHPDKNPDNQRLATAVFQRIQAERARVLQ